MATGLLQTYDLTTGIYLDIEPMIHILSPFDIPLQGGQGADGRSTLTTGSCFEKKVEWQDEELLTPISELAASFAAAATFLTLPAGDQLRFSSGDVLKINDEHVRVTGYGTTVNTLTVTREYAGTDVTHDIGDAVVGVGTALPEGSDPELPRAIDRNNRFNNTQIFGPTSVHVSGTENVVRKYGTEGVGEFNKQVANRTKEHFVGRDQALLYGTRVEDTTNGWRSFGGIDFWITTNVDSSTTTISEVALLSALQTTFDAGGRPDRLLVGATQKRKISAWTAALQLNDPRTSNARGTVVDFFDSDFGRVSVLLDRWVQPEDAFLFSREQAEITTLRPFVFEMLAKTGDSMKGQLLSEITMKFRRQSHAFKFSALT